MKIFKMHAGHINDQGRVQAAIRFNRSETYYRLYQDAFDKGMSLNQLFNNIFEEYAKGWKN